MVCTDSGVRLFLRELNMFKTHLKDIAPANRHANLNLSARSALRVQVSANTRGVIKNWTRKMF